MSPTYSRLLFAASLSVALFASLPNFRLSSASAQEEPLAAREIRDSGTGTRLASSALPKPDAIAGANSEEHSDGSDSAEARPDYRGWDYLAGKLILAGVPASEVATVFGDPRMPERSPVSFKLKPRETKQMYSSFTTEARLSIARQCLSDHLAAFEAAERSYHVSRFALAGLLLVETHCGKIVGSNLILNRLARVASIAEPENITFNFEALSAQDKTVTEREVAERARYLEDTFFPELKALFDMLTKGQIDVFDLHGSVAGAFGIPQFLPSSFLKFAVDGDSDGEISLFSYPDAIASAAHFLSSYGWNDRAPLADRKKALWHYNHSEAYGEAILKVAILLRQPAPSPSPRSNAKRSTAQKGAQSAAPRLNTKLKKSPLVEKKH